MTTRAPSTTPAMHLPNLILLPWLSLGLAAQDGRPGSAAALFGLDKVWEVAITVAVDDWLKMLPTRRPAPTERADFRYVPATVRIAGHPGLRVGLRFKGNSTFWMTSGTLKRSFKLDFDRYRADQTFLGLKKLNLNNNAMDGTQIREAVAYHTYRESGVPAARTAFARVTLTIPDQVAGEYLGLYTIVEQVDQGFLRDRLDQRGALVKPRWSVLHYHGDTWNEDYDRTYEPKSPTSVARMQPLVDLAALNRELGADWSDGGKRDAAAQRQAQTAFLARLERVMDVDAFLRYTAVTTLIGNQDSPFLFPHNYYLAIPDKSRKVLWLPWDLNNALGGLGFLGGSRPHDQSILKPTRRVIFARVLEIPACRARYLALVRQLVEGPCSAARIGERVAVADRSTDAAKQAERRRAAVVTRAGRLGGQASGRFGRRLGLGGSSRTAGLLQFARRREASVLDQLAGRSEGVAARPSLLDALLRRR